MSPTNGNEMNSGKNYTSSDIHGKYELYKNAKDQLNPGDTLWVIGDAVDKGEEGIKIIQDMMKCTENDSASPSVEFLLGNHEWFILKCIDLFKELGITGREVLQFLWARKIYSMYYIAESKERLYGKASERDREIARDMEPYIEKAEQTINSIEEKLGSHKDEILRFIDGNSATKTLEDYYSLPESEQDKIYNYLETRPMMVTRKFGNKSIALVHQAPPIGVHPKLNERITYRDIKYAPTLSEQQKKEVMKSIFWGNFLDESERFLRWRDAGYTIIHGHIPTRSCEVESFSDGTITIDLGSPETGILALYCIEDDTASYIGRKGLLKKSPCKEVGRNIEMILGKNYFCSNRYFSYEQYCNAKNLLGQGDKLWILGNAVGANTKGLSIISDIIKRTEDYSSDPAIEYLFGNNERIFLRCIKSLEKLRIPGDEVQEYINNVWINRGVFRAKENQKLNRASEEDDSFIKKWASRLEGIRAKIDTMEEKIGGELCYTMFNNHMEESIFDWYSLSKSEQQNIILFLERCTMMVARQFGDKRIVLGYNIPPIQVKPELNEMYRYRDIKYAPTLSEEQKTKLIDSIILGNYEDEAERILRWRDAGYTIIHGHTTTESNNVELSEDGRILIDTGDCGGGTIALYCIEENKAVYIDNDGNVRIKDCIERKSKGYDADEWCV